MKEKEQIALKMKENPQTIQRSNESFTMKENATPQPP